MVGQVVISCRRIRSCEEILYNVHENRALTTVGYAGSNGQGGIEDVRRDNTMYMYRRMNKKIEYLPAVVVQVVMDKMS